MIIDGILLSLWDTIEHIYQSAGLLGYDPTKSPWRSQRHHAAAPQCHGGVSSTNGWLQWWKSMRNVGYNMVNTPLNTINIVKIIQHLWFSRFEEALPDTHLADLGRAHLKLEQADFDPLVHRKVKCWCQSWLMNRGTTRMCHHGWGWQNICDLSQQLFRFSFPFSRTPPSKVYTSIMALAQSGSALQDTNPGSMTVLAQYSGFTKLVQILHKCWVVASPDGHQL